MKLRFIGKDGSMGLKQGKAYSVAIKNSTSYIYVIWDGGSCPYSSPQALSKNWEAVKDGK